MTSSLKPSNFSNFSKPSKPQSQQSLDSLIQTLKHYWHKQGCAILEPIDVPVGAATFCQATFLRALGLKPFNAAFTQACRRPTDGRFGKNPNRLQSYYQFQVVMKPSPLNLQELYLGSLEEIGIDLNIQDVRFVEDNWESPTLGAAGLGWEVWLNGMEVTQFTYFQQLASKPCEVVTGELAYGLERLAMYLQQVDNVYDLVWSVNECDKSVLTYGDLFHHNEAQFSEYNFNFTDTEVIRQNFDNALETGHHLITQQLNLPAYEQVLVASHAFNLLDARQAISAQLRPQYIKRIRDLANEVAQCALSKEA